jgi:hypothetical protein
MCHLLADGFSSSGWTTTCKLIIFSNYIEPVT